jgi:hypothetical protein
VRALRIRYLAEDGWQDAFDSTDGGAFPVGIEVSIWFDRSNGDARAEADADGASVAEPAIDAPADRTRFLRELVVGIRAEAPGLAPDLLLWTRRPEGNDPPPHDGYVGAVVDCAAAIGAPVIVVLPPIASFDPHGREVWRAEGAALEAALTPRGVAVVELTPALDEAKGRRGEVLEWRDGVWAVVDQETGRVWRTAPRSPRPGVPAPLLALRRFAAGCSDEIRAAVRRADSARETRVREGQLTMPRSRWFIVFALGILTLVSIGSLHGDAPRGRVLALTLVTLAISFCFVVLFVAGRPFVGDYALQPDALRAIAQRASQP